VPTATPTQRDDREVLLKPAEVAERFGVDPKTIIRWVKAGKLNPQRTLGGHRRYPESEIRRLIEEQGRG
jgi:excisionase family DNA binding protein